jgi:alpha-tubulin suppressor-like RCC1 family protein
MAFTISGIGNYSGITFTTTQPPPPIPFYSLFTWGRNAYGQLGNGNTTNRSSPAQVGTLTDWSKITAAGYKQFGAAIKTDGTMWAWGRNDNGQLGLGNTTDRSSPVQIGALTTWLTVAAGYTHRAAIKTNGTMWTWGRNNSGQLGIGDTTNRSSPVQIGALTTWLTVAGGKYHSMAIG